MGEHSHSHTREIQTYNEKKALSIVLFLTATFMFVEAAGGIYTGSLALLSDAGHMLTDVFALSIAFFALWFASKPATSAKTFGFFRAEIIAAFFNSILLFAISIAIFFEAYKRIQNPQEVKSLEMTIIAVAGLLINMLSAYILIKYQSGNLNIRGALFHVLSDAIGSVGAIVAGLIMLKTKWYYADPIISIIVAGLIVRGAWVLFSESVHILLEGTPKGVDLKSVQNALCEHVGVVSVHDLHVWTLTQGREALSAHLVIEDMHRGAEIIKEIKTNLDGKFHINHVTLQLETEECDSEEHLCYDNNV